MKLKRKRFFRAAFTASFYTGLSYSFPACKSFSGLEAIKWKGEVDSCRSMSLLELLTYSRRPNVHVQPSFLLLYRNTHCYGRWCCLLLKLDLFLDLFTDLASANLIRPYRLIKFSNLQLSRFSSFCKPKNGLFDVARMPFFTLLSPH